MTNFICKKPIFKRQRKYARNLGLSWDKAINEMSTIVPKYQPKFVTKRNFFSYTTPIYNSLGIISPSNVLGKAIYCELCN